MTAGGKENQLKKINKCHMTQTEIDSFQFTQSGIYSVLPFKRINFEAHENFSSLPYDTRSNFL